MSTVTELVHNAMHSSGEGFIGVSAIFVYFVIIVTVAFKRIKQLKAADHH